jgi:hypothetical protein
MLHHRPLAAVLAILAALVLAPSALAAAAPSKGPGSATAKAKERAYGKHCGPKRTGSNRPAQRAKCVEAMSKLATGRSSSPRVACRALSHRKARGARRSAFAQCVAAGAKLLKSKGRGSDGATDNDEGDDLESEDDDADGAGDPDDLDPELDGARRDDSPAGADGGGGDPDEEYDY